MSIPRLSSDGDTVCNCDCGDVSMLIAPRQLLLDAANDVFSALVPRKDADERIEQEADPSERSDEYPLLLS